MRSLAAPRLAAVLAVRLLLGQPVSAAEIFSHELSVAGIAMRNAHPFAVCSKRAGFCVPFGKGIQAIRIATIVRSHRRRGGGDRDVPADALPPVTVRGAGLPRTDVNALHRLNDRLALLAALDSTIAALGISAKATPTTALDTVETIACERRFAALLPRIGLAVTAERKIQDIRAETRFIITPWFARARINEIQYPRVTPFAWIQRSVATCPLGERPGIFAATVFAEESCGTRVGRIDITLLCLILHAVAARAALAGRAEGGRADAGEVTVFAQGILDIRISADSGTADASDAAPPYSTWGI